MLNYEKLIARNPYVLAEFTNSVGQKVILMEHPIHGEEAEIIAVFPKFKKAFYSGSHDMEGLTEFGGDYEVMIVDDELIRGFEL